MNVFFLLYTATVAIAAHFSIQTGKIFWKDIYNKNWWLVVICLYFFSYKENYLVGKY